MSDIEWTDDVWNPTTGCDKVSPGCGLPRFEGDLEGGCYAMAMAKRLKAMGEPAYQRDGDPRTSGPGFGVSIHSDRLDKPLRWRKPRRVFVNSMSDLFHDDVPDEFLCHVFDVMATAYRHTFQVLSKRHARMRSFVTSYLSGAFIEDPSQGALANTVDRPPRNIWLGVSVEDHKWAGMRIPALRQTPAAVRFLSCEPLLGPLGELNLTGIGWVIIGGESGPGARPMDLRWAVDIVRQCQAAGVPVFVKQLGSRWGSGHHEISLFPPALRVREYPADRTVVPA